MRVRACISELRGELKRAAKAMGVPVVGFSGGTNNCHSCGADPSPDNRADLVWTCAGCGAVYDQDVNASMTLRQSISSGEVALNRPDSPEKMSRSERMSEAKRNRRDRAIENNGIAQAESMV